MTASSPEYFPQESTGASSRLYRRAAIAWQRVAAWPAHTRVTFVLCLSAAIVLGSAVLRFRVCQVTTSLYPDYYNSAWSPFVQLFKELSWCGIFAGTIYSILAVHRWLRD